MMTAAAAAAAVTGIRFTRTGVAGRTPGRRMGGMRGRRNAEPAVNRRASALRTLFRLGAAAHQLFELLFTFITLIFVNGHSLTPFFELFFYYNII